MLFLAGCAQTPVKKTDAATKPSAVAIIKPAPKPPRAIQPLPANSGTVISINAPLRFVIVEFASGNIPAVGSAASAYRAGQKVAELKFSGPVRNTNIAADLRAGEVQVGDEVRLD